MRLPKLRKWSAVEDKLLLTSVNSYLATGACPDYRSISKRIPHRSPKQCRERYENSLQPDVKRGEWSLDETITLATLMTQHGQNWAAIKEQLTNRTYNAIKKKGRKILGEIVDRNCIPKGTNTKASPNWPQKEFKALINLHLDGRIPESKRHDYLFLALNLKTGRSEAEIERQLLQNCNCDRCSEQLSQVFSQDCDVSQDMSTAFKEKWSLWKAGEVLKSLEEKNSEKAPFRGVRRTSSCSMSSTSSKRRRVIKMESQLEDDRHSLSTSSSLGEMPCVEDNFFGLNTSELLLNLQSIQRAAVAAEINPLNQLSHVSCTPLSDFQGDASLKEFDLSFLLPL